MDWSKSYELYLGLSEKQRLSIGRKANELLCKEIENLSDEEALRPTMYVMSFGPFMSLSDEHGKEEYEQYADKIRRQAVPHDRSGLYRAVGRLACVYGAVYAERYRYSQSEYGGKEVQYYRVEHGRAYDLNNRTLIVKRLAEIPLKQTADFAVHVRYKAHPPRISDYERVVKAELRP